MTLAIILCVSLIACGKGDTPASKDEGAFSVQDYVGAWKYEEYEWIVVIADDGIWYDISTDDPEPDTSGVTRFEDGSLQLISGDTGSVYLALTMQDSNTLTEAEGDRLVRISLSDLPKEDTASADPDDFLGNWKYDDYDGILSIFDNGTWTAMSQAGEVGVTGNYVFENGVLILLDGYGEPDDALSLYGTDVLAIYDSDCDIHATVRNVTAAYLNSPLDSEEFIVECVDVFMEQDMYYLFGTEQVNSDEYADLGRPSALSSCRVRLFWNEVDILVETELYASTDSEQTQYVLKCFYAQYEGLVNGPLEYM